MYWYKPVSKYLFYTAGLLLLGSWLACKPEIKETGASLKYFDLKGFFHADSARLAKLNQPVTKTVTHNGITETKSIKTTNWGQEFGLFIASDINKPAWKDSYSTTEAGDSIVYKAKFAELKTREIVIRKEGGKVTSVFIHNYIHNLLYNTTEKLIYQPGKFYSIEKDQKVKVMGANNYLVKGTF